MAFRINWTEDAICDLRQIISHIAAEDPAAASHVGNDIIHVTELLTDFPHLGPPYPRGSSGPIRELISARKFRIIYRVLETTKVIEILRIWHGSREEPRFFLIERD